MFFNRVFREKALRRRARQEPLDDRLQITAPHEWLIVVGLGAMLFALVLYAIIWRVERTVSFEATLVLPGERQHLVAPASGTVLDVLVEESDIVAPGQTVAHIRTSASQHWESVIEGIIDSMGEDGQSADGNQVELLRALLVAGSAAESGSEAKVIAPYGGEVMELDLTPGQAVSAGATIGLVRAASEGPPEVVAFVSLTDAGRLKAGMDAQISIPGAGDKKIQVLSGRVAGVSSAANEPPGWLLAQGLSVPQQPHEVRVGLGDAVPNATLMDGSGVSLRIVLRRESFVSLLRPQGGG